MPAWNYSDDKILWDHYERVGAAALMPQLPHHTLDAIRKRGRHLGLKAPHLGGHKPAVERDHYCAVCGIQLVRRVGDEPVWAFNRRRTCSRACAKDLERKARRTRPRIEDLFPHSDEAIFEACAARDRGDHSLLRRILEDADTALRRQAQLGNQAAIRALVPDRPRSDPQMLSGWWGSEGPTGAGQDWTAGEDE